MISRSDSALIRSVGVQRLEKHDAGANGERQQQVGQLGERVEQRQHAKHRVLVADVDDSESRVAFGQEVARASSTTPFGSEVVPEVYRITAGAKDPGSSGSGA